MQVAGILTVLFARLCSKPKFIYSKVSLTLMLRLLFTFHFPSGGVANKLRTAEKIFSDEKCNVYSRFSNLKRYRHQIKR